MKIRVVYRDFNAPLLYAVRGFQRFGDVESIQADRLRDKDLTGADLLFISDIDMMQWIRPKMPTVFEISSRGTPLLWRLGQYSRLSHVARSMRFVTILDTSLYRWLREKKQSWDWGKVKLVPNGLHYGLFQPKTSREEVGVFSVLAPKMGMGINLIQTANYVHRMGYTAIRFMAVAQTRKHPVLSRDVEMLRPRQFYRMPALYRQANVILDAPDEEALSDVANNTFLSAVPLIALGGRIGDIQSVHTKYLTKMRGDFGQSVDWFHEQWKDKYGSGNHYLVGNSVKELANHIIHLYENPEEERKLAERGRKWADELGWGYRDKCKLILNLCKEKI